MFETVVPETFEFRSKRVFYETLPLSIALHAIGIGTAFVIAIWNVVFPLESPRLVRVHIERNQQLPLLPVSQEYPTYPEEARKKQLEDQVIVRYVIGKNGRVIDVQIINHAKEPMFDQATVEAIKQWRFRPMIKDGKP